MTLTLNLTSDIEQYLSQKAMEKGLSLEAYALKLLKDTILGSSGIVMQIINLK